jgi:predicted transcriptional regulator
MPELARITIKQMNAFLLIFLVGSSGCFSVIPSSSESNPFSSALSFIMSILARELPQPTIHTEVASGGPSSFNTVAALQVERSGDFGPGGSPSGPESSASQQTVRPQADATNGSSPSLLPEPSSLLAVVPNLWTDHSRKRSRFQVYVEILELLKRGPLTPFELAFHARLNHKRTKEYIKFLERAGYLELINEDGRTICVLSASGGSLVQRLRAIYALFESDFAARKPYA